VLAAAHQGAVVVIAASGQTDLRRAAAELAADCRGVAGNLPMAVGIGRPKHGLGGVHSSHREAEQALGMGLKLDATAVVVSFVDLGLHRLLYSVALGALIAYDEKGSGDLLRTLDAFFRCHGSPTETAQELKLHRNTVLYRLRRIEEVGRLRLNDPDTRLNLQLCLRIRDVLQAAG
jgi:purine catabolism regulator